MNTIEKLRAIRKRDGHKEHFLEGRYYHCRERMAERYDEDFTYEEWERLSAAIMMDDGMTAWIDMGNDDNTSLYTINYRGEVMLAVFSETAYVLMTILPRTDYRLAHVRDKRYIARAQSDADLVLRDARRRLAERLPGMTVNELGFLVAQREEEPVPAPAAEKPTALAEALRPVLTLRAPVVPDKASPAVNTDAPVNHRVKSIYARLQAELKAREDEVANTLTEAETEIAQLEKRIADLRNGGLAASLRRDMINATRSVAERAFEQHANGQLNDADAIALGDMMLAQQSAVAPIEKAAA